MAAKTKKKGAITAPTKKTMNFVHHQSSINLKKLIPVLVIVLIAGALFAKFGILDQLDKKTAAYNELGMKQDQLNAVSTRLAGYEELNSCFLRLLRDAWE